MPYSSSLTDQEWEILDSLVPQFLPQKKQTSPSDWTKPDSFDGILHLYGIVEPCSGERLAIASLVLKVSDWRTPRSSDDQLIPGDSSIPLGRLLHAVHAVEYRDACMVEIFSQDVPDSLHNSDLRTVGSTGEPQRSRQAWRQAHVKA